LKIWRNSPQAKLVVIGGLMALALMPGISGCSVGLENPITKVLRKVGSESLTQEARRELSRFDETYREYVKEPEQSNLDYFEFAFKRLRSTYVRPTVDKDLVDAAVKGIIDTKLEPGSMDADVAMEAALDSMTASLDPHTAYYNREEYHATFVAIRGEFGGLGIEVTMEDGFVKVVAPIEDTPAAKAGMLSGDLITHVNSEPVKGKSLGEAVLKMRGTPGTKIVLKVRRAGRDDFDVTIVRAIIKVRAVRWRLVDNIGYIRVNGFSERVEGGIITALASIKAELGRQPDGIVLDLRNNPGGLLDQSVILADAFLEDGEIVSVRGRNPNDIRSHSAEHGDLTENVPMVVLINGGAASASEIVASALKHHKRATIMGTRSFGKGSVQTIIPLPVYGALKLTTALYYGPDGKTIQAQGVVPDILIEPEETVDHRKESDNPDAFTARNGIDKTGQSKVHITSCKEVGERKDRELGCAIEFLQAGSTQKFLATRTTRQQM
jgi:carboxyl-terminal processing protease